MKNEVFVVTDKIARTHLVKTCMNLLTLFRPMQFFKVTVKQVLSGHSKIDKTKVLRTGDGLVQVESIAERSKGEHSAKLLTCIKP